MMKVVVDTNVAMAANGRDTHANFACQYKCIEFLEELCSTGKSTRIFLDQQGLIFTEYSGRLKYKGQPGIGDMFFKYLHDHMYLGKKIRLVSITPIADDERGFNELPSNQLDKSGRKFLATAVAAKATIVNAVDTDWNEQHTLISGINVKVDQLCPDHACLT